MLPACQVSTIISTNCVSAGEALRLIDQRDIIKSDFILVRRQAGRLGQLWVGGRGGIKAVGGVVRRGVLDFILRRHPSLPRPSDA